MPRFAPFFFAIAFASGCVKPRESEPTEVTVLSLSRVYRDTPHTAATAWTNRTIRVRLAAKDYSVTPSAVQWFDHTADSHPAVVFDCESPPADNTQAIIITGTCRGRFVDGKKRRNGTDFYVFVSGCVASP